MIPKYRVFDKKRNMMIHEDDLLRIDFEYQVIEYQEIYPTSDGSPERDIYEVAFDDCVFMQSTSVHDVNSREIHKDDIVKMHYFYEDRSSGAVREAEEEIIGVVGIDVLGTYTECEGYKYYWLNYLELPEEELEVIGNAYENPEILEVQNG
ncbi:YopX family protein [Aerococcaceae bacterium NML191219]|nr:YopX family protein [Aerococcaceae bacterium NML191219]